MTVSPLPTMFSSFLPDIQRYSLPVAVLRVLRSSRAIPMRALREDLEAMPAYRRHVALHGGDDPLFYLSHRHYLASGLGTRARALAALSHYGHESRAFDESYFDQVYLRQGLVLWSESIEGVAYDIRLMPGNDVLYEGGLSVVFHVDGARVCVLSFSMVPEALLRPGAEGEAGPGLVPFVVRKHLSEDHSYQAAFNKAFDRATPAHLCLGALAGVALAQGIDRAFGIAAERQVSFPKGRRDVFGNTYDQFWSATGGRRLSPFGFRFALPLELPPLEAMNARQRKRARTRRAHLDAVQQSARERILGHLAR